MSFSFPKFFAATEQDVVNILAKVKQDAVIAVKDVNAALKWISGNIGLIDASVQEVLGIVTTLGATSDPKVAAAIKDANVAVAALNAYAAASNSGQNNVSAVVNGYVALKQAQASVAAASAASAATVVPPVK